MIDPHALVAALARSARDAGAIVTTGAGEARVEMGAGRVAHVATAAGAIACGACVVAAGAGAADALAPLGVTLPLRPSRRRIYRTDPRGALTPPLPLVMQSPPPFYLRVERSAILLSAAEETPPEEVARTDVELLATVAARAVHRVPALADAPIRFAWSGLRVLTPDGRPFVGAIPSVPGLHVAVGLGGQGVMHAPAVAAVLAVGLAGTAHPPAAALGPLRTLSAASAGAGD